jgi:hypothetical protein
MIGDQVPVIAARIVCVVTMSTTQASTRAEPTQNHTRATGEKTVNVLQEQP